MQPAYAQLESFDVHDLTMDCYQKMMEHGGEFLENKAAMHFKNEKNIPHSNGK